MITTTDYWPYGAMLNQTGSGDTRFKYTGHERDDESALDYMLARMYENETGRFMQMDPLAEKYPGISPYVYTAGNPLKFVDPDGKRLRLFGGSGERGFAFTQITGNLTSSEKNQVGIKFDSKLNEYRVVISPNYVGTSKAYEYLKQVVTNDKYVTVKVAKTVLTTEGELNVSKRYGGGATQAKRDGSSEVTLSPDGSPVGRPKQIIAGHEIFGHSRLNLLEGYEAGRDEDRANAVEDELRDEQGLPSKTEEERQLNTIDVTAPR